jgi:hypothetical protein
MAKERLFDKAGLHFANGFHAAAAGASTLASAVWKAPCACKVEAVYVHPDVAITGDNTNHLLLETLNGGAAGAGTTAIGSKDFVTNTNVAALAAINLSPTTPVAFAEGDVLLMKRTLAASGLALGACYIQIQFRPT